MKKVLCLLIAIMLNLPLGALAETGIYHKVTCQHAKRCKKCIKIEKKEAKEQGGRPCKTCGG